RFARGTRVGVPWLGWTCGVCEYCRAGRENLCDRARFTGYQIDGGYAELTVADERYCFPLPDRYSDAEAAPLLCAGLIGARSLRMAGDARRLGGERVVRSVANLTRRDAEEFLATAGRLPLRTRVATHPLIAANEVLASLRAGAIVGAAALVP